MNYNLACLVAALLSLVGCFSGPSRDHSATAGNDKESPLTTTGVADTVAFPERCASPGVFKCISFDRDSDFVESGGPPEQTVYPNSKSSFANVNKDCTVAVNGCSIRFTVPASPEAGANMSGKYEYDFVREGKELARTQLFTSKCGSGLIEPCWPTDTEAKAGSSC